MVVSQRGTRGHVWDQVTVGVDLCNDLCYDLCHDRRHDRINVTVVNMHRDLGHRRPVAVSSSLQHYTSVVSYRLAIDMRH